LVILYETFLVASYTLLVLWRRSEVLVLFSIAFVVASLLLRLEIDIQSLRDFTPYFSSFQRVKYDDIPPGLWIEPYRLLLFEFVILFGDFDDITQITAIYYIHFAIVTLFFLWLAWLRDVAFEIKLLIFLAFYPGIAFVWLRSGMAYVAAGYLLYTFSRGRTAFFHYLLPAFHSSTLVLLVATKTQDLRLIYKIVSILIVFGLIYALTDTAYGQYVLFKLDRYNSTGDLRASTSLLLFHAANLLTVLYLALVNQRFRKNYAIRVLVAIYFFSYLSNPIMALRIFPFVLIIAMADRSSHSRYPFLSIIVISVFFIVYFARFNQIFL